MTDEELKALNMSLDSILNITNMVVDSRNTQSNLIQSEKLLDKKAKIDSIQSNAKAFITQQSNNAQELYNSSIARTQDVIADAQTWNINNNDLNKLAKNAPELVTDDGSDIAEKYGLQLQSDLTYSFQAQDTLQKNVEAKRAAAEYTDHINSYIRGELNKIESLKDYVDWDPTTVGVSDVAGIKSLNPDVGGYIDEADLMAWFKSEEGQETFNKLFPDQIPETVMVENTTGDIARRLFTTFEDNPYLPAYTTDQLQIMELGADSDGFIGPELTNEERGYNERLLSQKKTDFNYAPFIYTHRDKANGISLSQKVSQMLAVEQMVVAEGIKQSDLDAVNTARETLFKGKEALLTQYSGDDITATFNQVLDNVNFKHRDSKIYDPAELKFDEGDLSDDINFSLIQRHQNIQPAMLKLGKTIDSILSKYYAETHYYAESVGQVEMIKNNKDALKFNFNEHNMTDDVGLGWFLGLMGEDSESGIVTMRGEVATVDITALKEFVGDYNFQFGGAETEKAMFDLLVTSIQKYKILQSMQIVDPLAIQTDGTDATFLKILDKVNANIQQGNTSINLNSVISGIDGVEMREGYDVNSIYKYIGGDVAGPWIPEDSLVQSPTLWDEFLVPAVNDLYKGNKDIYSVNEEINKTFNGDDIDWDQYDDISYDPYIPPPTREDITTALYSDPAMMGGGFDYSKSPIVSQIHSQNIGGSSRSIDDLMEYIKQQN